MICPVCIATAAVIAGSATGTGGVSAFVATRILKRKGGVASAGAGPEGKPDAAIGPQGAGSGELRRGGQGREFNAEC